MDVITAFRTPASIKEALDLLSKKLKVPRTFIIMAAINYGRYKNIEDHYKIDRSINKDKHMSIRISTNIREDLKKRAHEHNLKVSGLLTLYLTIYIEKLNIIVYHYDKIVFENKNKTRLLINVDYIYENFPQLKDFFEQLAKENFTSRVDFYEQYFKNKKKKFITLHKRYFDIAIRKMLWNVELIDSL